MKNLFLVDGASATGKSDLLRWVHENNAHDVSFVVKATTRPKREYEENSETFMLDLEFISEAEFAQRDPEFSYVYRKSHYGFARSELNRQLLLKDNVFVIVRNVDTIRRIVREYSFLNVVPIFIYSDRFELEKRLRGEGLPEEVIVGRLDRSDKALQDYYAHPNVYRDVLINNSSQDAFHNVVERLIEKYSDVSSIDPYLVAVMMSFNPHNKKLGDYYDAMESAVHGVSGRHRCERVDNAPGSGRIAAEFRSLVKRARCGIVDLTENKQNVYYELGYAHAHHATCILTAEAGTTPSFYPSQHKIIFYDSARDLKMKLGAELARVLGGPTGL
jgi:guanylate kinase